MALLRGSLDHARRSGFDVTLLCSPGEEAERMAAAEGCAFVPVPMEREIAPLRDLVSLFRVWRALGKLRPTLVNAGTPKAGLLVTVAAWARRVPCRIYTLQGLRLETAAGLKRLILGGTERVAAGLAHRVVCISESLRRRAADLGLFSLTKAAVVASANGVDVDRYAPTEANLAGGRAVRRELGIPEEATVVGYVGRVVRDKGIIEIAQAWRAVSGDYPDLHLLLVGGAEAADRVSDDIEVLIDTDPRIHPTGFVADPVPYYAAMDILVLPSYREGFANVVIEANAMGRPVVATRVTGLVDSVADGVSGTLVPVRDGAALADALRRYLADPEIARAHGEGGRQRVLREFTQEQRWEAMRAQYEELLVRRGQPLPGATRR